MALSITQFSDHKAASKIDLQWDDLDLDEFAIDPPTYQTKADCGWIKLAKFGDARTEKNSLRHDANVVSISGGEGDYDAGVMPIATAADILHNVGIRATLYTSASNAPDNPKWRVWIPFSHEYEGTPDELRELRTQMVKRVDRVLGNVFAQESYTLSQSYYIGQIEGKEYKSFSVDGDCIDQREDLHVVVEKRPDGSSYVHTGRTRNICGSLSRLDEDECERIKNEKT